MKKYVYVAFFLFTSINSIESVGVQVEVNAGNSYGWQGPGWYYGHYFRERQDYIDWMEANPPYDTATYQTTIWVGPGWYGGYWYGNKRDWDVHYQYNSYNRNFNYNRNKNGRDVERLRNSGNNGNRRENVKDRAKNRGGDRRSGHN